jgi:hypothetical protein
MRASLLILLCLFSLPSWGQQSLTSAGGDLKGTKVYLSFTVGEVFYDTKGNSKDGIQQGFIVNRISSYSSLHLSIFPNPTTDLLYFKVEDLNYENLHYFIYDFAGLLLASGTISDAQSHISLKDLPSQNLLIKCYRSVYEQVTYKVIKIN